MATNFSPCKGSYVLNQFPSNVMFGMNGFHVSASGAIQGHHGPLVYCEPITGCQLICIFLYFPIFCFKILYFEKPRIFPIFSYLLENIPIFLSKYVANKCRDCEYFFETAFGFCILQVREFWS